MEECYSTFFHIWSLYIYTMGLAAASVPRNEPNTKQNVTQPMHAQLFLVLTQHNYRTNNAIASCNSRTTTGEY